MRTLFVSLCAALWMAGCGGSSDPTATGTDPLKGGQSAQHRNDAGNEGHENEGGVSNGVGNGQGAQIGQGTGDGKDCKPADGGPSPCAQGKGLDDGSAEDGPTDIDDGGKNCGADDGGPSPCSRGHHDH